MNYTIKELTAVARSVRSFNESQKIEYNILKTFIDTARITPSAGNLQPLKYRIVSDREETDKLFPLTKWAGYLTDVTLPPEGHHPTGYIVICHDESICKISQFSSMDVGIAAQTIFLSAYERGIAGCMIGSFDAEKVSILLNLPKGCTPVLIIALGVHSEHSIICNPSADNDIKYFRDDSGVHFVPKRQLKEVLIK